VFAGGLAVWGAILLMGCAAGGDGAAPALGASPQSRPCAAGVDCAAEAVLAQLQGGEPSDAVAMVEGLETPEERWLVVSRVVAEAPERSGVLCAALGDPDLQERCTRDTSRPHLYAQPPTAQTQPGQRSAPGPHSSTLVLQLHAPSRFAASEPRTPACPGGRTVADCAVEQALDFARKGRAAEAASTCLSVQSDRHWRGECAFQAAEAAVQVLPPHRSDEAVELCLMAEEFVGRCVDKIHHRLALLAPPASASEGAWRPVLVAWHVMALTWAAQPAPVQALVQDAYWSSVVDHAYRQVDRATGAPLDLLPPPAHAHVRASVASVLLRDPPQETPSLDALGVALSAAMSSRPPVDAQPPEGVLHSAPTADYWPVDGPRDEALPAVHYRGRSRRVHSEDPSVDRFLCLLEAAARADRAWHTLLDTAWTHPDPFIGQTARRLSHALGRPDPIEASAREAWGHQPETR